MGQNFLVDSNIGDIIIRVLELNKNESIFEIGTGLGSLTLQLIPFVEHIFTIEKDIRFKPILNDLLFQFQNSVTLIYQDILYFNMENFLKQKRLEGYFIEKLVGNLPYSISLPLLKKIFTMRNIFKVAVVMVQKEVGDKILAKPGDDNYGFLSILSDCFSITEKIHLVKPKAFFPEPKIDSIILKIRFLQNPKIDIIDEDLFFEVVNSVFQYRRKNLINALNTYFVSYNDKKLLEKSLTDVGINPKRRGETLTLEEFSLIVKIMKHLTIN